MEDEALVAQDLELRLTGLGYEVAGVAATGAEALRLALAHRPDVILMDIVLKGPMDGIDAAGEVRARIDVPVIFVTAYSDAKTLDRAKATEPYSYVLKPFSDRELQVGVEIALYRSRSDRKVKELQEWLAAALRSVGDGVIATTIDSTITFMNPVAEQITGWSRQEAVSRPLAEVLSLTDRATRQPIDDLGARTLQSRDGPLHLGDMTLRTKGGEEVVVEDAAAPIRTSDGRTAGIIVVFRDVTDRRNMEAELQQVRRLETLGRLAGAVAHDFNNLLGLISGFGQLALTALPPDHPAHQEVDEILKATERGAALSRQLLAVSQRQTIRLRTLNMNSVIQRMETLLRRLLGSRVQVRTPLAPDLGNVKADPSQLEQVLLNLAVNARDAMPNGGQLTIGTENVTVAEGERRRGASLRPGRYVKLEVADTGTGIAPDVLPRIFEPFFTTKEPGKGTGLGLATVDGILRRSGGAIRVESEPGRGARFLLYFPLVDEPAEPLEGIVATAPEEQG